MQFSQDVEKRIFPLKLIWIALCASLIIYAFVVYKVKGFYFHDQKDIGEMKNLLQLISFIPFVFTLFVSTKKNWVIGKFLSRIRGGQFSKSDNEKDKKILEAFSPYFIFHILIWAINESGAILAFVLTFTTGNATFYLGNATIALFFNLILFKPNFKAYLRDKNFE